MNVAFRIEISLPKLAARGKGALSILSERKNCAKAKDAFEKTTLIGSSRVAVRTRGNREWRDRRSN